MGEQVTLEEQLDNIIKRPWVLTCITLFLGSLILVSFLYSPETINMSMFSITVILFILPLIFTQEHFGQPFVRPRNNRIAVVVFVWSAISIYLGGGGILSYIDYPFSKWIFSSIYLFGAFLVLWLVKDLSVSSLGLKRPEKTPTAYVLIFLALFVIHGLFFVFIQSSFLDFENYLDLFVTATAIPAIFEEIVFRGVIMDRISSHYNSRASGIFLSSLGFGLLHGFTNLSPSGDIILSILICIMGQFLGGVAFGLLYYHTGSIIPGILAHYVNNMIVWLLLDIYVGSLFSSLHSVILSSSFLFAAVIAIIHILGSMREDEDEIDTLSIDD